jgi:antitoxin ParD1/3/4
MDTLQITLPEPMKTYVEKQVAQSGYKDAADFVMSLVENHQRGQLRLEVEAMMLETVDGPFTEWTRKTVEDIRREGMAILNREPGA